MAETARRSFRGFSSTGRLEKKRNKTENERTREKEREIKDQSRSCAGAINVEKARSSRDTPAEGNFFNFEHPRKLSTNFPRPGFTATD